MSSTMGIHTNNTHNSTQATTPHTLFHNPYGKPPKTQQSSSMRKRIRTTHQLKINNNAPMLPSDYINVITKKEDKTRICFLNVNGLQTGNKDRVLEIANYMQEYEVDIFGICETNLNTTDTNLYNKIARDIKKHTNDKKATITATDTKVPWNQKYKPGGTAIITTGEISSRTTARGHDNPFGLWSTIFIGPLCIV